MAAVDPSAEPEEGGNSGSKTKPRATLKMVYDPEGAGDKDTDEDDEDDDDEEEMRLLKAILKTQANGEDD